jgi:Secretion system C-terminal sorting domain/SMP-30/Gluconolactonase/LRE-like region
MSTHFKGFDFLCSMKKLLICILLFAAKGAQAQTLSGPESVDCDTLTNTWYVGNTASKQILRRNQNGTWESFISGLSAAPYGIEVVGDRIYACMGAAVKGFNLSDGVQVLSVATQASFLNGITHDDNGFLYATDFGGKKIYKINTATSTASVFVTGLSATPNGILFEKAENRLVFATWGANAKVMAVSLADSSVTTLKTTTFSNIDGIAQDGAGRFYLAHWGANAVHRFDQAFALPAVSVVTGLSSPADIYYNVKTDTLGIPNSGNNTVRFVGFAPVSGVDELEKVENLVVYPNPASDFITFNWENAHLASVQITDALGRTVSLVADQQNDQCTMQVGHLESGWYQLVVRDADGVVAVGRFMKK